MLTGSLMAMGAAKTTVAADNKLGMKNFMMSNVGVAT
jgi:hypothetical protein